MLFRSNAQESIISFERIDDQANKLIAAFNFTPVQREAHPIGVDAPGDYEVVFNSNQKNYGGELEKAKVVYTAVAEPAFNKPYSIRIKMPTLGGVFIKYKEDSSV